MQVSTTFYINFEMHSPNLCNANWFWIVRCCICIDRLEDTAYFLHSADDKFHQYRIVIVVSIHTYTLWCKVTQFWHLKVTDRYVHSSAVIFSTFCVDLRSVPFCNTFYNSAPIVIYVFVCVYIQYIVRWKRSMAFVLCTVQAESS